MGWVDQVPGAGKLYIGGLYGLYQTDLISAAGITHVLSAIDYDPLLQQHFSHLKHFHVRVDDDPNQDLLQYFDAGSRYIDEGISSGGGVFVHCAMGKSRSATFVVAYLMWKCGVTWERGLDMLCKGRPVCDPNVGFKEQLGVWQEMLMVGRKERREAIYKRWLEERFTGEPWEWEERKERLRLKALMGPMREKL